MPRFIVKIRDLYCEWSPVVDTPTTTLCNRADAVEQWSEERIARCDANGDSCKGFRVSPVAYNRAGPKEVRLTEEGLYEAYKENGAAMQEPFVAKPEWLNPIKEDQ